MMQTSHKLNHEFCTCYDVSVFLLEHWGKERGRHLSNSIFLNYKCLLVLLDNVGFFPAQVTTTGNREQKRNVYHTDIYCS